MVLSAGLNFAATYIRVVETWFATSPCVEQSWVHLAEVNMLKFEFSSARINPIATIKATTRPTKVGSSLHLQSLTIKSIRLALRPVRIGIAALLLGFLLVFFLPLVPVCSSVAFPRACLSREVGPVSWSIESIGFWLIQWGGSYSYYYVTPPVSYMGYGLTDSSVLLFVVAPIAVISLVLLVPEILKIKS